MGKTAEQSDDTLMRLSVGRIFLFLCLIAVVVTAVIAYWIIRPDRNAELHIIYTGDIQGQTDAVTGSYAGYEKIAALADQLIDEGNSVLLLDVGNCLGGSAIAEMDNGKSILSLMNAAGYDAMLPSFLDFLYGADALSSLRAEATFPFLAANIKKSDGSNAFENYQIVTINQVQIAIIGVTLGLNDTQASLCGMRVEDAVETVSTLVEQLSAKADAIVVMAYTGDETVTHAIAELESVVLVIESGSTEAFYEEMTDGTVIVSAGQYGAVIGGVKLSVTSGTVKIENEFYTSETYDGLTGNETVAAALDLVSQTWTIARSEQAGQVISSLEIETEEEEVSSETEESSESSGDESTLPKMSERVEDTVVYHTYETEIGNMTADALLNATSDYGTVVAMIEDQAISGSLSSGIVTRGELLELYGSQMYVVVCKMTGGEIRAVLENNLANYPDCESFLQIAGLSYTYTKSSGIGSRLSDISIGGNTLDDAGIYVVAMTNTLADELGYLSYASGRIVCYRTVVSEVYDYISSHTPIELSDAQKRIKVTK